MTSSDIIVLNNLTGISRPLSGMDSNVASWTQFEVDYFAEQDDGECAICGEVLAYGWMCLDGGEEVCDEHVYEQE